MQSEKQKLGRTEALHTCQEWGLGTNESATLTYEIKEVEKKNNPLVVYANLQVHTYLWI